MQIQLSSRGLVRSLQEALQQAEDGLVEIDMDELDIGPAQATAFKHLRSLFKCERVVLRNGTLVIEPAAPLVVGGHIKLQDVEVKNVEYSVAVPPACMFVVEGDAKLELVDVTLHPGAERKKVYPIMVEDGGKLVTAGGTEWKGTGPIAEDEEVRAEQAKAKKQQEAAAAAAAVVAGAKPAAPAAPSAGGAAQLAAVMRNLQQPKPQTPAAPSANAQTLPQLQVLLALLQAQNNPAQLPLILQLQAAIKVLQAQQAASQSAAQGRAGQSAAAGNGTSGKREKNKEPIDDDPDFVPGKRMRQER
uniref:Uncharacterized protein n=1 Tax=Chlamydomonas leiostraca TaxID=1034604 RepID=A0A7S0RMW2_9CHLO|mmetsp:Transcript_27148/g.69065  ORF Transcript_27148/g.69065 Transcript_27148/m.69065 type:complete len:303 (+) Transcript_27148:15-923(+)